MTMDEYVKKHGTEIPKPQGGTHYCHMISRRGARIHTTSDGRRFIYEPDRMMTLMVMRHLNGEAAE